MVGEICCFACNWVKQADSKQRVIQKQLVSTQLTGLYFASKLFVGMAVGPACSINSVARQQSCNKSKDSVLSYSPLYPTI